MPQGRLYVLKVNHYVVGCIALRKIDDEYCEMKRLFIKPEMRGQHLGYMLVEKIIKETKEIGYHYMLLDTLPFLKSAIHMYKKFGFIEIEAYNHSPMADSIYMKLDLTQK